MLIQQANKLLCDFSPIRAGGGCQLALNFLERLEETSFKNDSIFLLLPDSGPLAKLYKAKRNSLSVSHFPIKRCYFEYVAVKKILRKHRIKNIFTFFGPGLPHPKNVRSVVGVAYPIICYDDSLYWKFLPMKQKYPTKLMNYLICWRLKKADLIIAETPIMAQRLAAKLKLPKDKIIVLPPAVTVYIEDAAIDTNKTPRNFLLLSGNSPHKNLWRLYDIAAEILKLGINDFIFVLSVKKNDWLKTIKSDMGIEHKIIDEHFDFVGGIAPNEIQQLYSRCDALMNLSDLESFSNNYMEAWKAGLPIIASDRDFARYICRGSAIYCEPHNPKQAATVISQFISDSKLRYDLAKEGKKRLMELPDVVTRMEKLHDILYLEQDK